MDNFQRNNPPNFFAQETKKEMKFLFIIIYLFFVVAGSGVGKIGKASAVTVKVYSVSLAVDFLSRKVSLKRCCIIFCDRDESVQRIMERDGKTREEAERRLDSQISNTQRCQVPGR